MCATQLFEHIRGLRSSLVARFREQQAAVSTRSRAMNMSVPARYDVNFQLTIEDVRDIVRQLHERGDIGEAILAKHNHQIENVADAVHASFIRSYQLIRNQTFMSSLEYMVARIEKVTGDDEEQATSVSMLAADPAETDPALLADLQSTAVEAKHRLETTERRLQDALLNAEAEQSADVDAAGDDGNENSNGTDEEGDSDELVSVDSDGDELETHDEHTTALCWDEGAVEPQPMSGGAGKMASRENADAADDADDTSASKSDSDHGEIVLSSGDDDDDGASPAKRVRDADDIVLD